MSFPKWGTMKTFIKSLLNYNPQNLNITTSSKSDKCKCLQNILNP